MYINTQYLEMPKGIHGVSVSNEDGSFTVLSAVTVNPHDDGEYLAEAETLFVKNEKSAFGYNIIYSNIKGEEDII